MTHTEKLNEIKALAILAITTFLLTQEDHKHLLFDMSIEDWNEDDELLDEFMSLPAEYVSGKHYADIHYAHTIYLKEGKLYVDGHNNEGVEEPDFTWFSEWLTAETLCTIADCI